mmetsp:Transcript_44912/g.124903  ORF Transcript_44912/g.124903 Transcript_44912/m.124903 type:complete len:218 (+) Transcript_44912:471-1124(+)
MQKQSPQLSWLRFSHPPSRFQHPLAQPWCPSPLQCSRSSRPSCSKAWVPRPARGPPGAPRRHGPPGHMAPRTEPQPEDAGPPARRPLPRGRAPRPPQGRPQRARPERRSGRRPWPRPRTHWEGRAQAFRLPVQSPTSEAWTRRATPPPQRRPVGLLIQGSSCEGARASRLPVRSPTSLAWTRQAPPPPPPPPQRRPAGLLIEGSSPGSTARIDRPDR